MDIEKARAQNFGRSILDTGMPVPDGENYMVNSRAPRTDTFQEINLNRNISGENQTILIASYRPLTSEIQIKPFMGVNFQDSSIDETFGKPNFENPYRGEEHGHKKL